MKIAIFSDTFPPQVNGVANTAFTSAYELARRGHDVYVFTVSHKSFYNGPEIHDNGGSFTVVRLPSLPLPTYMEHRFSFPVGLSLRKISNINPDVIHTHTPFGVGWEAVYASKLFNIPLVGTHHTFLDHYLKHVYLDYDWAHEGSWKYSLLYYNRCDILLCPSKSLNSEFANRGMKKPLMVLPNSIDTDFFKPDYDKAVKNSIVYMGRVSYEKNIDQVIRAVSLLVDKIPDIKLTIVGDGPEKGRLEEIADDLGIRNHIAFVGFKKGEELVEVLQRNQIFVTASKSENMPLSVLEAMACGLPIVAADSLGMPEIVRDGENGYLFEPDNINDIAEKIQQILSDEKLRKEFAKSSREIALEYSVERFVNSLEEVYSNVINGKEK